VTLEKTREKINDTCQAAVLRAYIEQGGAAYHIYCHDDTGNQWHTLCDDVYTMAGAMRELENRAFHWGFTHVQLTTVNGEQIGLSYLAATPYRLQRLANRSPSTVASAGTLPAPREDQPEVEEEMHHEQLFA
jgi:hypothetical protein